MSELNNNTPLTDENKGDVSQSNIALTSNVEPLSKPVYILGNIGNAFMGLRFAFINGFINC